jgi:hypothetical protein
MFLCSVLIFLFHMLDLSRFCHQNVCVVLVSVMSTYSEVTKPEFKKNQVRRLGGHPLVSVHWPSCVQNWLQHVTPASKNFFKISSRAEVVMVDPHIHSFSRLLAISSQASPSRRQSSQAPPFSLSKIFRKQNLCKDMKIRGREQ